MEEIKYIGIVHSSLKEMDDCPLQEFENAPSATIEIFPEFIEGIKDIKPGEKILVLTWLHKADRNIIKCVRRKEYNTAKIGVFSTRSPDRPNPVGLHEIKVLGIKDNMLTVDALEALNETPVIDIKPVLN